MGDQQQHQWQLTAASLAHRWETDRTSNGEALVNQQNTPCKSIGKQLELHGTSLGTQWGTRRNINRTPTGHQENPIREVKRKSVETQ